MKFFRHCKRLAILLALAFLQHRYRVFYHYMQDNLHARDWLLEKLVELDSPVRPSPNHN